LDQRSSQGNRSNVHRSGNLEMGSSSNSDKGGSNQRLSLNENDAQRIQETVPLHRDQGPRADGSLDTELQIPGERPEFCSSALFLLL